MASHVSCVRETARQGRPRFVRAFLYLSYKIEKIMREFVRGEASRYICMVYMCIYQYHSLSSCCLTAASRSI